MAKIIMPLPAIDCDPTETAIPWKVLHDLGHDIVFTTPEGKPSAADDIMLSGEGLDPWGWIPILKKLPFIGLFLRANRDARDAFDEMINTPAFQNPLAWKDTSCADFDGLLLPGGHRARGIRAYLESKVIQDLTVAFFNADKPIAAICHGALIPARSIDPKTGKSVLFGRKTTALTWQLESTAAKLARFTRFWDPNYYRTYQEEPGQPEGYMSVEHEIIRSLEKSSDFIDVPRDDPGFRQKTSGLVRDTADDHKASWVVQDDNYVTARWPGDAHAFASAFAKLLP